MMIDDLVRGSIDMHLHHGPDLTMPTRSDALETARQARAMGMRAIVLKNQNYPTVPLAPMVNQLVPEVKVFGSICLDYDVGGLNYYALETSAKLGAKVVWLPTHSSKTSPNKSGRLPADENGLSILTPENKPVPEMERILSLVKEYNMVLATGHISARETMVLAEEALAMGITKFVVTHASTHSFERSPDLEEQRRLGQMGAFIEYIYVGFLPNEHRDDPQLLVRAIRNVGAEHCIIGTDLGQAFNPTPAEGMRMFIALLLKNGISEREIELMAKVNPAKLLGLD
jgi:predicted TIM-barrel fold metal-dependent hydrolase